MLRGVCPSKKDLGYRLGNSDCQLVREAHASAMEVTVRPCSGSSFLVFFQPFCRVGYPRPDVRRNALRTIAPEFLCAISCQILEAMHHVGGRLCQLWSRSSRQVIPWNSEKHVDRFIGTGCQSSLPTIQSVVVGP